jgi:hypothetical protein
MVSTYVLIIEIRAGLGRLGDVSVILGADFSTNEAGRASIGRIVGTIYQIE